jgi:excisionase family DNA binding protein
MPETIIPVIPDLLDVKEVAAALLCSERKVWHMRATGKLPAIRIGRRVLFDRVDVAALIERGRENVLPS